MHMHSTIIKGIVTECPHLKNELHLGTAEAAIPPKKHKTFPLAAVVKNEIRKDMNAYVRLNAHRASGFNLHKTNFMRFLILLPQVHESHWLLL